MSRRRPAPGQTMMTALAWSTAMTEKQYQALIVKTARTYRWKDMHVNRMMIRGQWLTGTSVPGWPDLTLWHPSGRMLMLEVKTETGTIRPDQLVMLQEFQLVADRAARAGVPSVFSAYCVRPSDFPRVERLLAAAPLNTVSIAAPTNPTGA